MLNDLQAKNEELKDIAIRGNESYLQYLKTKDEIDSILGNASYEIAIAKDEKGKVLYSNEAQRNGALLKFKSENEEYKKLEEKLNELYREYTRANIEVSYLKNYIRNIRAYLESTKNEL